MCKTNIKITYVGSKSLMKALAKYHFKNLDILKTPLITAWFYNTFHHY